MIVLSNFGNCLLHDSSNRNAKVCAYDVHYSKDRCILGMIDYYIGILLTKLKLKKVQKTFKT